MTSLPVIYLLSNESGPAPYFYTITKCVIQGNSIIIT